MEVLFEEPGLSVFHLLTSVFMTVTTAVSEFELPLTSVTVKVTVFSPVSLAVKFCLSKTIVSIPQLSVELLLISEGIMDASTLLSKVIVIFCVTTTGSIVSSTVITCDLLTAFPAASSALQTMIFSPGSKVMPATELLPF